MAQPTSSDSDFNRYLVPPHELQFAEYVFRLDIFKPLPKTARRRVHKWFSDSDKNILWIIINALANKCGGLIYIQTLSGDPIQDLDVDNLQSELSSHPNPLYKECLTFRKELVGNPLLVRKSDVFITADSRMYTRQLGASADVFSYQKLSAIMNQTTGKHNSMSYLPEQFFVYKGICAWIEAEDIKFEQFRSRSANALVRQMTQKRCEISMFSMPNLPNGGHFIIGVEKDISLEKFVFLGVDLNEADKQSILSKLSEFMQEDNNGVPRVWGKLSHKDIKEGIHWFCKFIPLSIPSHTCDVPRCSTCPSKGERYLIHLYFPHCPGGVFLRKPEAFILNENGSIDGVEFTQWLRIHQGLSMDVSATSTIHPVSSTSDVSRPSPTAEPRAKKPKLDIPTCADNITLKFSTHSSKNRQVNVQMANAPMSEVTHPEKFDLFQMSNPASYTPPRNEIESVLSDKSLLQLIDEDVGNTEAFALAADSLLSCIKQSASRQRPPQHLMDVLVVNKLASIMLFVICSTFRSTNDKNEQWTYAVTLGRILKMKITDNSKCVDIVVQCQILTLDGLNFRTSQLVQDHASPSHANNVCMALAKILTEIPSHFSDKIKKDASLEMSAKDFYTGDDVTRFNFIEGPPGSGKTLLAQAICKKHGTDESVYMCKTQELANYVRNKFGINTICVLTNENLLSKIQNQPEHVQNIIIDDAQNLQADPEIIKQVLDYVQEKQKILFVLEDCRYQNFQCKNSQKSFATVYSVYQHECMFDDDSRQKLPVIRRNSDIVGCYITTLLEDIAPTNRARCESGLSGDDIFVRHIPNLKAQNNNGLVAHVQGILSNKSVNPRDKHYTIQDVAILMDHTDKEELKKEVCSLKRVFESAWPESCVQSAGKIPVEGVVMDSLDNFCGLEARVVVFVLPKIPLTDNLRSISNPKYTLAIASRGIDRVDFVQEENLRMDQLEDLKFDSIPASLLKDTSPVSSTVREEDSYDREGSTPLQEQEPGILGRHVTPVDLSDPAIKSLLKNPTAHGVYEMSKNPRGRAVIVHNYVFDNEKCREGAEFDAENLEDHFEQLGFQHILHENKTAEEMKNIFFEESRRKEHENFDCLIVFVLSHGKPGIILGKDGRHVSIEKDIITPFDGKHCPALINKPKIFFIQACQGDADTQGISSRVQAESIDNHDAKVPNPRLNVDMADKCDDQSTEDSTCTQRKLEDRRYGFSHTHEKSDIVLAYSTVTGYRSYRGDRIGSWFVRAIVEVFSEKACEEHLLDLLVLVRSHISKKQSYPKSYVQLTRTDETAKKKIYFFPGYHEGMLNDLL